MINLLLRNKTKDKRYTQTFFERILRIIFQTQNVSGECGLSITLVGDQAIRMLNRRYRGVDRVTDVLSFPLGYFPYTESQERLIGDIFICLPYARRTAKKEEINLSSKLAWLTVHGCLHLFGHDHEQSDKDARNMFHIERRILGRLSL